MKKHNTSYIIIVIILVLIIIPIKFPQSISVRGRVFPEKTFMIIKSNNGDLNTLLTDNKLGVTEQLSNYQIERGDKFSFSLNNLEKMSEIEKNSKIASITSSVMDEEIIELKSELNNQSAYLKVLESSEKNELVKAAESRLNLAEQKVLENLKIFNRQKALLNKDLISQEDFDIAEGNLNLAKIEVRIAKEELNSVKTGEKKEEIDFVKTRIEGLKNQLEILSNRRTDYEITSPIKGFLVKNFNSDTLLTIQQNVNPIFNFPIKLTDVDQIFVGQEVKISINGRGSFFGNVFHIGKTIRAFNGNNFLIVQVESNDQKSINFLNASVDGNFSLQSKTILEIVLSFFEKEFSK